MSFSRGGVDDLLKQDRAQDIRGPRTEGSEWARDPRTARRLPKLFEGGTEDWLADSPDFQSACSDSDGSRGCMLRHGSYRDILSKGTYATHHTPYLDTPSVAGSVNCPCPASNQDQFVIAACRVESSRAITHLEHFRDVSAIL